jgi:RNA processing factor Prp31
MRHYEVSQVADSETNEALPDKDKYIQALETNMELNKEIKMLKETLEWYKTNFTDVAKKKIT